MCVRVCELVCAAFCTVVGGPVAVVSFDLGQVWHSDGWAPGHTQALSHRHTNASPPCFLPGLMLALSNFELTYKYHRIKLLHMAPNPIHSTDTLTSHYPVGKNGSFLLCTVTSSAMFEKQAPNHLLVQTLTWLGDFQIYMANVFLLWQPPGFCLVLIVCGDLIKIDSN